MQAPTLSRRIRCAALLMGVLISLASPAQKKAWDKLLIDVPADWSWNARTMSVEYNNYNLREEAPMSIAMHSAVAYDGKLDTLFAHAWNRFAGISGPEGKPPRWRRFYTEDGVLIQQGGHEYDAGGQPMYLQLNVYVLEGAYQPVLIRTAGIKAYREKQQDWQQRLQGATLVKGKGK